MSDTGTPLGTVEHNFSERRYAAGQKVLVPWKQGKGRVMRINVKAWDTDNFYGEIELFPWKLSIPHEEIHFVTGSAEIPSKEEHKLFSSLKEISDAIVKYGSLAKLQLFIAGHTDSVGDSVSNRSLSQRRARSIGQWFRKKGIKISIMAAGLGEDDLLVETPDNTDEIREIVERNMLFRWIRLRLSAAYVGKSFSVAIQTRRQYFPILSQLGTPWTQLGIVLQ